jgi:hypothetical protein
MKYLLVPMALALSAAAVAKLPPPDEAAKAKAAETAAKSAWQAKVDGYLLCKAQDKVVAQYRKTSAGAKTAAPAAAAPAPASTAAAAPVAGAAPAAAPAAASAQPTSGTPVTAASPPPPCTDPGPFAYNPPAQKPLETSGAHSPTGTAATPPSVKEPSAAMAPAKKP